MAEEHKGEHKKKRKPRHILTTRHDDGSYSHEHIHDGKAEKVFAGTSAHLEDVKQHMDDHFGGGEAEPAAGPVAQADGAGPEAEPGE